MKTKSLFLMLTLILVSIFSCKNSPKDSELNHIEDIATNWQETFKTVDLEKLKPFLDAENHEYLKTYIGSFSNEQIAQAMEVLKNQETKIVSSEINDNVGSVQICCDAYGDEFIVYLNKQGEEWKVDFIATIEYAE